MRLKTPRPLNLVWDQIDDATRDLTVQLDVHLLVSSLIMESIPAGKPYSQFLEETGHLKPAIERTGDLVSAALASALSEVEVPAEFASEIKRLFAGALKDARKPLDEAIGRRRQRESSPA
jgi:hypothetical protein